MRLLSLAVLACALVTGGSADVSRADELSTPAKKPPADIPGIVFVASPMFDEKTDGGQGVYQGAYHWHDSYIYPRSATYHRAERTMGPNRPGRNLYALVPARSDGKLTRLTHLKTGAVYKPEPSFDGKKILFAMRRDGEDWFHQYEVNVDGTGLRQLTDGPFNDFGGVYLPDGRIVFCSDRTGYLEEYHEERTETLFVMNGDGKGISQITFLPGTYFEPTVLRDGRILFSFWDAFHIDVPPFDKHETYLMTVHPDGTQERHLFGAGQYRFFNRERHSGIGLTQARQMPDGRILVQSEMGPSLLDLRAGLSVRDALAPIFPGTTSIQVGGTTHRSHLSPLGTRSTAYPLQDGRILYSATAPGARDSAIYVCDPDTREAKLVLNIPNYAEFDAVPVLVERQRPARLPEVGRAGSVSDRSSRRQTPVAYTPGSPATTRFLVVAGRVADNPQRAEALKRARFFRVVEAEYTGVTTSSHTNLETRILGVAPIFPDGSCYFEAPADTPIFLDPIDAAGNRVLMKWGYPNTSVKVGTHYPATQMAYMSGRAGETRSCYGCHATQTEAVPNVPLQALKYGPVRIARKSTDLQYRRNEPEAYRRQARIDEVWKYIACMESKDPVSQARACEMLMYIEDLVRSPVQLFQAPDGKIGNLAIPEEERLWWDSQKMFQSTIESLVSSKSVEVRRAASLALTRLATIKETGALRKALKDSDWQVRFAAAAALEALGEMDLLKAEPLAAKACAIPFEYLGRQPLTPQRKKLHAELAKALPDVLAIRAAGKVKDDKAVKFLVPLLSNHQQEYHAAEAAIALGRVGTPEAVAALWKALRSEVPKKQVHISRYLQHGPRPEEYAILKALLIACSGLEVDDVYLLIALLPNTFMEKPRFEDRMRAESQRVLMARLFLERAGLCCRAVDILLEALQGRQKKTDPLYGQILKGINLERPFSEHGRAFPTVQQIGPEECLWLLGCLLDSQEDRWTNHFMLTRKERGEAKREYQAKRQHLETLIIPFLTSKNQRERVDAAVLLGKIGFGPKAATALAAEIAWPYPFPEIASMGKGMPDANERDKAYMAMALAQHVKDVETLRPFADPKKMCRDIRYGLVRGLALRGKFDGLSLLVEMYRRDPITLIRQQARYAIEDIQDAFRLAGKDVPQVTFGQQQPLEALYPPRDLKWADTSFPDPIPKVSAPAPGFGPEDVGVKLLSPANFRDLNMAQATGARFMMTVQVEETRLAFEALSGRPGDGARKALLAALETPYPYGHYLAARALAKRGDREAVPVLVKKLEPFLKAGDTVGFWACCEALGRLKDPEAIPVLVRHAVTANPPGTFGPEGMATGYAAAWALGYIIADAKKTNVARLLASDNVWLKAGVLRGLAEAHAPGVEELLRQAAEEESPALVRQEARVQLTRLRIGR
jgi:HEAT repeat protein